jgi:hypothetical protein
VLATLQGHHQLLSPAPEVPMVGDNVVPDLDHLAAALLERLAQQQRLQRRVQRLAHVLQQHRAPKAHACGAARSGFSSCDCTWPQAFSGCCAVTTLGPSSPLLPPTVLQRPEEVLVRELDHVQPPVLLHGLDPAVGLALRA